MSIAAIPMAGVPTRAALRVGVPAARSARKRLDAKALTFAVLVILGLALLGGLGLVSPIWNAPLATQLSRFTETALTGVTIFVAVALADAAVDRGAPPLLTYVTAVLLGSAIGAGVGWELREAIGLRFVPLRGFKFPQYFAVFRRIDLALIGLLVGGLATFVHVKRRTALAARLRQHAAEQARATAKRQKLESELQALQARVEPLFLFDTLKRIRALYRSDAAAAGDTLEHLIVYLRAALPHMRESSSTVEQETTLVGSWLDIVGSATPGWQVTVSVAESTRALPLPALVLLPLVQHAVSSAPGGGVGLVLRIETAIDADRLLIRIATSSDAYGQGVAGKALLEEIEARLRALYGDAARLDARRAASGSEAKLSVPVGTRADHTQGAET